MKSIKNLVLTSTLAASFAGSAFGNTTTIIHLVGAPAFRQPVNDAIETVVEGFANAGLTASSSAIPAVGHTRLQGSTTESAKANQWLIPSFEPGVDLEINASYTGSTAGVESVASGGGTSNNGGSNPITLTQKFIPDSNAGTVASPVKLSATELHTPDNNWITNSDTFQASTLFNGAQTFKNGPAPGRGSAPTFTFNYQTLVADLTGVPTYGASHGHPVGVEVYHWVASPGAPSDFKNITTAQAKYLYQNGVAPLSYFTGNAAEHNINVYALTRDAGSGARTIALAEIGVQPPGTDVAIQSYVPTISGGVVDSQGGGVGGTITANALAPAGQIPSTQIYEPLGDTGYASFGSATLGGSTADSSTSANNYGLLQAITATPQANTLFVTYLDNDDTNEALVATSAPGFTTGGNATLLTYNGVAASLSTGVDEAVANGQYTFWSDESFLAAPGQSSTASDFESQVETAFPSFAALPYTDLNVTRSVDGGAVTPQ